MGKIHIMDEWLSNKIAAGEVVERPASVVKELVENAIDAGATSIEIFLEEAGLTSIQVIDNGDGMDEEDAIASFARHATSKIEKEQDLFRIRTLGFRGEALASIASVSKLTMMTSDGNEGVHLVLDGGKIVEKTPQALRKGTNITVAQLFFNTPARLKYLKTIQTELGHCVDLINRLALGNPGIAFKLVHNKQLLLQTNGRGQVAQVLAAIYGTHNAKKMFSFSGETNDYKIEGFATMPEITRASKNYLSIYVNGRWVKHYLVQKAIVDAFHTFLPIERFPIAVLFIEGDPQLTDVNVHPAKHQVRLSKETELLVLIEQTIRAALQRAAQVPQAAQPKKIARKETQQLDMWQPKLDEEKMNALVERMAPVVDRKEARESIEAPVHVKESEEMFDTAPPIPITVQKEEPKKEPFPALEVIGQIHGTYIVAQKEDGFYLIDQHAAQERIKYEYYREKVGDVNNEERQTLLLPLTFHYAADEALRLIEQQDNLQSVGIYLEPFGQNSFVVREHPTWYPKGLEREIIEDLIEQVLTASKTDIKKLREEAAIMMSCKKSIKANYYLTKEQMTRLLDDLRQAENPLTCPHGRPVLIHFSTYELEKMFKRVM